MENAEVKQGQGSQPTPGKLEMCMLQGNLLRNGVDNPAHDCAESPLNSVSKEGERPDKEGPSCLVTSMDIYEDTDQQPDVPSKDVANKNSRKTEKTSAVAAQPVCAACGGHVPPSSNETENGAEEDCNSDSSSEAGDLWDDWVEEKDLDPSPHAFYTPFRRYLAKVLTPTARTFLSNHLNQDIESISSEGYTKDWSGLAECMGKDYEYTVSFNRFKDPAGELLKDWQTESGATLGKLLHYLKLMDRYDILFDVTFMDMIHRSVQIYDNEREEIAKEREERRNRRLREKYGPMACGDTEEELQQFSAFVCFEPEDSDFVKEMIYEVEQKEGLKVCIDARDLLAGQNEQCVTAEMIKKRCNRTIVVLSYAFIRKESEMCQYAMRVAQSLSPAASRSKMIPVRIEPCDVPPSLVHITPVDFTRCRERSWLWRKVVSTLRSTQDPLCMLERQKLRHISLYPKEMADLRATMEEEEWKPPVQPKFSRRPLGPIPSNTSTSSKGTSQNVLWGYESHIRDTTNMSKKDKLKESFRKFFGQRDSR